MEPLTIAIVTIIVLVVLWVIFSYNSLIRSRNRVSEAWSDIDVQLKRRYDLIPNLVETVKGYASHERETLEKVVQARSAAINAKGVKEQQDAENMLTGALKSIFALSEAYPDLKASQNFAKLQDELTDTENKIQAARRFYNSNVLTFNTKIQQFPTNIMASMFKFGKSDFFEVGSDEERKVVSVKF